MELNGAQIIMKCLAEQNQDIVFGFPGGAALFIYDALYKTPDLKHILSCHEQHAAHAADGYARATGKTGVVFSTSGPGATNLVTGIATAYMDSTPLVAITSNVTRALLGKDSFQEVDIAGITAPITKHNVIVRDTADLADAVREAFYIAASGRKGPVLIDVPKDISFMKANYKKESPKTPDPCNNFTPLDIETAAKAIAQSSRPFIYAGGGVIASGASELLQKFAEKINAPVATSLMGIGAYPYDGKLYTGMIGMHGTKVSALCATGCDLLISIGARFSDRVTSDHSRFAKQTKVLHIDVDPAEINKNIAADYEISGNAKDVLELLTDKCEKSDHKEWAAQVERWKKEYPLNAAAAAAERPKRIIDTAQKYAPEDARFTTEVGQHQMWAAQFLKITKPRQFFTSGGLGTMGFGLGAAIGAAAGTGKRIVNFAGDGSFLMNFQELITAKRYNLPVTTVVLHNSTLGMVRQWQKLFYEGHYSHTTLGQPLNYELLGKAMDIPAYYVKADEDPSFKMEQAFDADGPSLIACEVDIDENVLPMIPGGKDYDDIILTLED